MKTSSKGSSDILFFNRAIWIYCILLIFEGALRKWFLPGLATPLLLVREPIVIWLVIVGVNRGWLKNNFVIAIAIISSLSFLLSISVGHQNLGTAFYGWRIYLFHIPFIFIIYRILTREDVIKIGRIILYISIPMTVLIILQFYSPQSAWVNRGIGGDTEGAGFSGALGFFRPSGTFSFTSGYVMYQLLVGSFLFYYLVANVSLPPYIRIKPIWLWTIFGCYLLTIPFSISRSHLIQSVIVALFMVLGSIWSGNKHIQGRLFQLIPIVLVVIVGILFSGLADDSLGAFTSRFESANEIEGGVEGVVGDRYIGGMFRGLYNDKIPFWGYGLGLGTNVGANLAGGTGGMFSFFNGEGEWGRMTSESGLLLGWSLIAIRIGIMGVIFFRAYRALRKNKDMLPWMLCSGMLLTFPQGQFGIPTNLGFCIFIAGLTYAATKERKKRVRYES